MKPAIIAPDFNQEWDLIKRTKLKEAENALPEWKAEMEEKRKKKKTAVIASTLTGIALLAVGCFILGYVFTLFLPLNIVISLTLATGAALGIYESIEPCGNVLSIEEIEKYYSTFSKQLRTLKANTEFEFVYNTWEKTSKDIDVSCNPYEIHELCNHIDKLCTMYEICNQTVLSYKFDYTSHVMVEYADEKGIVGKMWFDCEDKTSINVEEDTFVWENDEIVLLKAYKKKKN